MKKFMIGLSLLMSLSSIPPVMAAGGQNVPIHSPQSKRVEQWHKNQSDRFKDMEEEVAMSFRNLESESRNNRSCSPVRKR